MWSQSFILEESYWILYGLWSLAGTLYYVWVNHLGKIDCIIWQISWLFVLIIREFNCGESGLRIGWEGSTRICVIAGFIWFWTPLLSLSWCQYCALARPYKGQECQLSWAGGDMHWVWDIQLNGMEEAGNTPRACPSYDSSLGMLVRGLGWFTQDWHWCCLGPHLSIIRSPLYEDLE